MKSRKRQMLLWIGSIIWNVVTTLRGYCARRRRIMSRMKLKRIIALVNGGRWYGIAYQLGRSRAQLMKELATEFNELFTEVGVHATEEAKRLAPVNGLPTSHQEIPVSFICINFELLPLSRSIGLYSHFLQIKHQGKINYKWQWWKMTYRLSSRFWPRS